MAKLTRGGIPIVYRNATWASHHLKLAGLLESAGHGYLKITKRGSEVLAESPSKINRKYLSGFRVVDGTEDPDPETTAESSLLENPDETIQLGFEDKCGKLYQELKEALANMSPAGFEKLVLDVCKSMGYGKIRHTGESGDHGIDGVISADVLGLEEICIQAKRRKDPVGPKDVRDFVGALAPTSTQKGIFITTSSFTKEAHIAASNLGGTRVILIDGDRLVELMNEYGTGVVKEYDITINKVDTAYFEQFD